MVYPFQTGHEEFAIRDVVADFSKDTVKPFIPTIIKPFKKSGIVQYETQLLFPGYIFVETKLLNNEFVQIINKTIYSSKHLVKLLTYGTDDVALKEDERRILESIWDKEKHQISSSKGVLKNNRITIIDGPLMGMESKIKKINRHKMQAMVEVELLNKVENVMVGLEII